VKCKARKASSEDFLDGATVECSTTVRWPKQEEGEIQLSLDGFAHRCERLDLQVEPFPVEFNPKGFEGETQGSCARYEVATPKNLANPICG
jgi:hypothetical protein